MGKGSTDWFALGFVILGVLYFGKTYDLMPFIFGHPPCVVAPKVATP